MDDWQVGDLALCIGSDLRPFDGVVCFHTAGMAYQVTEVRSGVDEFGQPVTGIKTTYHPYVFSNANQFRKIHPSTPEFGNGTPALEPVEG